MKKAFSLALFLFTALFVPPAFAANEDAGLYDPAPPDGSAFVRFVSINPESGSRDASIDGKTVEYVSFQELSSYFVTPEKKVPIRVGDAEKSFDLTAGKFYTVVLKGDDTLDIQEDAISTNLAKSQITFYNFSPQKNLSLKTSDGKVDVISAVGAGKRDMKLINPVKVSLAAYDGDKVLYDLGPVSMERARAYNVIVYPNHEVKWVPSLTNTTR